MSNINANQIGDGQRVVSTSGNRGQGQQIMIVPATRQQQVVYQQQIQQTAPSPQQHYILQQGGFDSAQHTYQVFGGINGLSSVKCIN